MTILSRENVQEKDEHGGKDMKRISATSVANAIKRGKNSEEIMERYQFSSREDLVTYIKNTFEEGDSFLSSLEKNDKRKKRNDDQSEQPREEEMNLEPIPAPSQDEDLEAKRDRLEAEAIELENEHKKVVRQRKDLIEELVDIRREVKDLELKLKKASEKVDRREEKINELGRQMNELSAKHSVVNAELSETKELIAEKNKLFVFVSNDGTIDVYRNNETVEVNFDGWEKRRDMMFSDESGLYDELSKKQLGMLAKLYVLKDNFRKCRIEFTLDAPYLTLLKILK